jgi:hypothetical protein
VAQNLQRVSLIKTDTDGHDFSVLRGAQECISNYRPTVIFEACAYLMEAPMPTFEEFAAFFSSHDYTICEGTKLEPINSARFEAVCPAGGGLDLVALPNERWLALRSRRRRPRWHRNARPSSPHDR